jgi:hypothetical protein
MERASVDLNMAIIIIVALVLAGAVFVFVKYLIER